MSAGREYGRYPDVGVERFHWFTDPVSGRDFVLDIGTEQSRPYDGTNGVEHDCNGGRLALADVSPELDSFYCSKCGAGGRVSGAWFMDLWTVERASTDTEDAS